MKPLTTWQFQNGMAGMTKTQAKLWLNDWFPRFVYSYIIRSIIYPHICMRRVSVIQIVLSICQSVTQHCNLICIIHGCSERYVWRARMPVSVLATRQWAFWLPASERFGCPPVSVSATSVYRDANQNGVGLGTRLPTSSVYGKVTVHLLQWSSLV